MVMLVMITNSRGIKTWDLFEGKHLFYGNDPDEKGYFTRAHLAEVTSILGPPPLDMLIRAKEVLSYSSMMVSLF
jgi:hypothetical protein